MSTTRQMVRLINKVVAPLQRRVMLTAARAYLLFFDDTTKAQVAQAWLLDGETRDAVERFQEYGFTSVPGPEGCEGAVIFVAGNRAHGIIVATEDRNLRPTGLNQGDVALYHTGGIRVYLDDGNDKVELGNSPTDFVALAQKVLTELQAIKTAYDTHTHGGVTTGGGATTGPVVPMPAPSSVAADEVKAK